MYLARAETSNSEICSTFKWRLFFSLFFYNMGVLISSLSHNILSLVSFIAQQANQNMAAKTTSFLYLCCTLTHNFRFLHDFELIDFSVTFLHKNDLYLAFKFKMVTTNTQAS